MAPPRRAAPSTWRCACRPSRRRRFTETTDRRKSSGAREGGLGFYGSPGLQPEGDGRKHKENAVSAVAESTHPFEAAREAGREPFKVADLSQAELGRKEIRLAEHEMPGLMALRE